MRIGIDIRTADPATPGQQRYLWRLGAWLAAQQHEVDFLTVRAQPKSVLMPPGTSLHRWSGLARSVLRAKVAALSLDVLLLNPERSRSYRGIRANVLRAAYGTDHYRQKLRSFKGPVESTLRKLARLSPWELAERQWERGFYHTPNGFPDVIAQSAYMKREIIDTYGVPDDHVHVIHNAVDTNEFSPAMRAPRRAAARERWGIPADAFCLLFVGHNYRLKGLWQVLQAMSGAHISPRPNLLVLGRGTGSSQRTELNERLRDTALGDRVVLAGGDTAVIDAYAAADALLHLTWHDSFGFVVLEAMACGLPVVTTRYAGASELIDDGVSGLIVEPDDVGALTAAIARIADPSTRQAMGDAAAAVGRAHDEPQNFAAVERVFRVAAARKC